MPAWEKVLIVEGGALRGVFSAGVLDGFLEAGFDPFDWFLGVSSGASNTAAFLARMKGRNFRIFTDHSLRPEFISLRRFLCGGHLMDLDWLWETTIREMRLDLKEIYASGRPFIVVATDVQSGRASYLTTGPEGLEDILKASSALPPLYRSFPLIDGRPMTDGGLADALPVGEAIRRGARRIMVIRSRPADYLKREGFSSYLLRLYLRGYEGLKEALAGRVRRYHEALAIIRRPPAGVEVVEVCPPPSFAVSRLSRSRAILEEGYRQGLGLAQEAIRRWQGAEP